MKQSFAFVVLLFSLACAASAFGDTFHVANTGNDINDGLSSQMPWRSLDKVNSATLRPGDKVLFKRDDVWRGTLRPQSGQDGAPITYGAYGEGDRPRLLGSVSRDNPQDWQHEGDHIWATLKLAFTEIDSPSACPSLHPEGAAPSAPQGRSRETGDDRASPSGRAPNNFMQASWSLHSAVEASRSYPFGTLGNWNA